MINIKNWFKIVSIIPITLFYHIYKLISDKKSTHVGEIVINNIYGGQVGSENSKMLLITISSMFYIVLFNLLYGSMIYKDFEHSSVYLFTRTKKRKKWLFRKSSELFLVSFIYAFTFIATNIFIAIYTSIYPLSTSDIKILIFIVILVTLMLFLSTLSINMLSIHMGNNKAFFLVYLTIALCVNLSCDYEKISFLADHPTLVTFIPMVGVMETWFGNIILQFVVLAYYIFLISCVLYISGHLIENMDIGLKSLEKES